MGPMMPAAIGWPEVEDYADRLEICPDDRETLHAVIRALDARWVEHEMGRIRAEAGRRP
jgi:hypothetical protein